MTTVATRGLAPVRDVLANGATVIVKESRMQPAVTISAAFQAGNLYDPADRLGTSYFLSRVIDRGTARRTAEEIAEALDTRGVALSAGVTRHVLSLTCTCLAEDFDAVLDLVADVASAPSFLEDEIEKRRGEIVTTLRQDEDNPAVCAVEGLMELLYPNPHPYGRRSKGTRESVEAIGRPALVDFHAARFAPASLSLVVVGDVAPSDAMGVAARALGDWRRPAPPPPELLRPMRPAARQRRVIPMMNKAQADIAYGFLAITRADPAYHAFSLMNNVLGQYSLGGRLGDSIRERQGMAYYVFSTFDANVVEGPMLVRAGVDPANVDRAVASIDEEIERMAGEGITERELADSKQYLIGSIPRMLETNSGIATFLQTVEQFGLGLDYDLRLPDLLSRVTRDEVHEVARRVLAVDRAAVVIAGPYAG